MNTPVFTLFRKESRQHGKLAAAMVALYGTLQAAHIGWTEFMLNSRLDPGMFLFDAVFAAALFAGAAAAIIYAAEHADKTFDFLRKLPVTPLTIALGKTGFVLAATLLVLIANLLVAALYVVQFKNIPFSETVLAIFRYSGEGQNASYLLWSGFGIAVLEALVWGFFWSTRCRSVVHALLATGICATLTGYLLASCVSNSSDYAEFLADAALYRLLAVAVVGGFAVKGMLTWFDRDKNLNTKNTKDSQRNTNKFFEVLFLPQKFFVNLRVFFVSFVLKRIPPYPQKVQTPFWALVHVLLRQGAAIYTLGIATVILWGIFIFGLTLPQETTEKIDESLWTIAAIAMLTGTFIFNGMIFGHDHKNDSYRFLARLGISETIIWRSRIIPALIVHFPLLLMIVAAFIYEFDRNKLAETEAHPVIVLCFIVSFIFTFWLAPLAVGAFCSVSIRNPVVAVAATAAGCLAIVTWMFNIQWLYEYSPLWTTLPICAALLIASRIQTYYWLRDTKTWKSRLTALSPIFVSIMFVAAAIPLVRIYSIPAVSWEQIADCFDHTDLPMMPKEKRTELIHYIAAHNELPPDIAAHWQQDGKWYSHWFGNSWGYSVTLPSEEPAAIKKFLEASKKGIQEFPTLDEYLLAKYVFLYKNAILRQKVQFSVPASVDKNGKEIEEPLIGRILTSFPWDWYRNKRLLHYFIVVDLERTKHLQDPKGLALAEYSTRWMCYPNGDRDAWFYSHRNRYETLFCSDNLELVNFALYLWYVEHGNTLPESLDVLVGKYLDALPVHPFTKEAVTYRKEVDEEVKRKYDALPSREKSFARNDNGLPRITLGTEHRDIVFPGMSIGFDNSP